MTLHERQLSLDNHHFHLKMLREALIDAAGEPGIEFHAVLWLGKAALRISTAMQELAAASVLVEAAARDQSVVRREPAITASK